MLSPAGGGALLDGEGALHPRRLMPRHRAEERVLAGLEIDRRRGRGAGDDVGAAEVLATRVGDVDVVADGRLVGEVDLEGPGLGRGPARLLEGELPGRVGADLHGRAAAGAAAGRGR